MAIQPIRDLRTDGSFDRKGVTAQVFLYLANVISEHARCFVSRDHRVQHRTVIVTSFLQVASSVQYTLSGQRRRRRGRDGEHRQAFPSKIHCSHAIGWGWAAGGGGFSVLARGRPHLAERDHVKRFPAGLNHGAQAYRAGFAFCHRTRVGLSCRTSQEIDCVMTTRYTAGYIAEAFSSQSRAPCALDRGAEIDDFLGRLG